MAFSVRPACRSCWAVSISRPTFFITIRVMTMKTTVKTAMAMRAEIHNSSPASR